MMERLLQNSGWLKAISAVLAILLWAVVVPKSIKDDSRSFDIKLEVMEHPTFTIDQGPRDREITVTVKAEGKTPFLRGLDPKDIHAVADYSHIVEPGKQVQVQIQVTGPNMGSGVAYSVSPSSIPVTLIENRDAMVQYQLGSTVQNNTVVYNNKEWQYTAKVEAEQIKVSGRSDQVDKVQYVRVVLDSKDLVPTNTRIEKKGIPTDSNGKSVDKVDAQPVFVSLTWKQLPPGFTFKVQPVTKGTLPIGLTVSSMEALPPTLIVRAVDLNGTVPEKEIIETEPIDLTGQKTSFTTTVRVVPPAGTVASAQTVTVQVTIGEEQQEKVFKGLPLTVRGTALNQTATTAVTAVEVRARGPFSVINALQASQLAAYVDVEGLAPGKNILPVRVTAPAGVAGEADPATVEVTVSSSTP
jgi:YbbR domain-containing protein